MFQSLKGGSSWSAINTGLAGSGVNALAIDPTTPTTLYAGTSGVDAATGLNGGVNSVLRSTSLITGTTLQPPLRLQGNKWGFPGSVRGRGSV